MTRELAISCACGGVHGALQQVTPKSGTHLYCHCSDCQDFARFLGAEDRVLDANGGTALFQSRCACLRIDAGKDKLASLHLTDQPTLRWYARCCRSPMFNTFKNAKLPYITVLVSNTEEGQRNAALGPAIGHLHLPDAPGDTSSLKSMSMGALLRRFLPRMIKDIVSGDRKRTALFDPQSLEPIAAPHRLTAQERANGTIA